MRIFKRIALLCAVSTLTGCASLFWEERDDLRFQKYATREILEHEGTTVSLPPLTREETTPSGRLTMSATSGTLTAPVFFSDNDAVASENKTYFTLRLQSELTKHSRFNVMAIEGNDDDYLRELADVGEIRLPKTVSLDELDLDIGWNVTVSPDTQNSYRKRDGRGQVICNVYNVRMVISGKNPRNKIGIGPFTKTYDDITLRCFMRRNQWNHRSGFRPDDPSAVKDLMQKLASRLSVRIVNEIYWSNPVVGEVTGTFGENMQLNRGSLDGIMPGHVMTIYVRRSGVVIPVAFATATPAEKTSVLEVWKWARPRDRRMREVVEAIRAKGLDEGPIHAVTYGVPTPPDYELKEIVIE